MIVKNMTLINPNTNQKSNIVFNFTILAITEEISIIQMKNEILPLRRWTPAILSQNGLIFMKKLGQFNMKIYKFNIKHSKLFIIS